MFNICRGEINDLLASLLHLHLHLSPFPSSLPSPTLSRLEMVPFTGGNMVGATAARCVLIYVELNAWNSARTSNESNKNAVLYVNDRMLGKGSRTKPVCFCWASGLLLLPHTPLIHKVTWRGWNKILMNMQVNSKDLNGTEILKWAIGITGKWCRI